MGRKNLLAGLLESDLTAVNSQSSTNSTIAAPTLGSRGAVGAMSRSLDMLSAQREAAQALADQLAAGHNVVEVDARQIDPSIIRDRIPGDEKNEEDLIHSIKSQGQLVPVLLRPHPSVPGRYQTAYGHRRVRALAILGLPVRAIIKSMTDQELVVAQGKENGDRRNLSYLERAIYAVRLETGGFSRDTIMQALSVDKTELSRLISLGNGIPDFLVKAIGPAPAIGRRRWLDLVELLGQKSAGPAKEVIAAASFVALSSDERFNQIHAALSRTGAERKGADVGSDWQCEDGTKIAKIKRLKNKVVLSVDSKAAPDFGEYLIGKLAELYREFRNTGRVQ